jgi:1-acyl-sn-glycerol-3-phosphate acyltransferase
MIYRFLYYVVGWALKVFYRKINISGSENLIRDKAYILACNHPAGFVEPLIMACFLPRDLYFLTRGDLFENKFYNYIFTATHQIPIFRFRDGFSNLRNNQYSISKAVQTLKDKKALLIFVEGTTSYQFDARPPQKGFARMGFQALAEEPGLDVEVLPVGISFSRIDKMGGDVILNIGKPLPLNSYFSEDTVSSNKGMNKLIEDTHHSMKKLMLSENTDTDEKIIRSAWSEAAKDDKSFYPKVVYSEDLFLRAKYLVNSGITTQKLPEIYGKKQNWIHILWILAIPSLVFTMVPKYLSNYYKNNKVAKLEFKIPVALAVGLISYLIQIVLILIIVSLLSGFLEALFLILVFIISGIFHLWAWENSHKN